MSVTSNDISLDNFLYLYFCHYYYEAFTYYYIFIYHILIINIYIGHNQSISPSQADIYNRWQILIHHSS
jgi:hypothetical protein